MIDVFYHMFCLNDYLERFKKTFNKIKDSGLYNNLNHLYINVVSSNDNDFEYVKSLLQDQKIKLVRIANNVQGEIDTLKFMHNTCMKNELNKHVLYLHSKGVSRTGNANVQAWIDYMEYFVITKWKDCLDRLEDHDTCGVNLQFVPGAHYSGNFWWANTDYLKKLKPLEISMREWKVPHCGSVDRAYCEFWLLDNNFCKPATLHNSGVDHYGVLYDSEKYKT